MGRVFNCGSAVHSNILDARPSQTNFLHFHAVLGKTLPNNRLVSAPMALTPPLGNPESAPGIVRMLPM